MGAEMKLTWANRITITRILLIVPFIILMLHHQETEYGTLYRYIALALFVIMAVSDAIDGYLARRQNQITKLGSFLDPMGDKLLMASALLLLASSRTGVNGFIVPQEVAILIIGKDLFLLIGFLIVYFMTLEIRIVPAHIGKLATVLQLSMVVGVLAGPEISAVIPAWLYVVRVLWWAAAITAVIATLLYIRTGIRYIEEFEQHTQSKRDG